MLRKQGPTCVWTQWIPSYGGKIIQITELITHQLKHVSILSFVSLIVCKCMKPLPDQDIFSSTCMHIYHRNRTSTATNWRCHWHWWKFKSSGMWQWVTGCVVPEILKHHSAFIFRAKQCSCAPWCWRWSPTKCQELLAQWHSMISQITSIFRTSCLYTWLQAASVLATHQSFEFLTDLYPWTQAAVHFALKGDRREMKGKWLLTWCRQLSRLWSVGGRWMSVEHWWNDTDTRKWKHGKKNPTAMPLSPPQILHGLVWDCQILWHISISVAPQQASPLINWKSESMTYSNYLRLKQLIINSTTFTMVNKTYWTSHVTGNKWKKE